MKYGLVRKTFQFKYHRNDQDQTIYVEHVMQRQVAYLALKAHSQSLLEIPLRVVNPWQANTSKR